MSFLAARTGKNLSHQLFFTDAAVLCSQAVDISPLRRVNQAIFLLTTGAREAAFRNIKTIAECLVR